MISKSYSCDHLLFLKDIIQRNTNISSVNNQITHHNSLSKTLINIIPDNLQKDQSCKYFYLKALGCFLNNFQQEHDTVPRFAAFDSQDPSAFISGVDSSIMFLL